MSVVVQLDGVSKRYQAGSGKVVLEALKEINLSVEKGSFVTLIGPSGCGKSTLLHIIAGMLNPSEGRVMIDGITIIKPQPTKMAMVFQEASLYPWKTVLKNVEFGLELRKVPKDQIRPRAEKYMELVGISRFKDYYPLQISGGMQQRVSIARALALETDVLLMDEPFGALDEQSRLILGAELTNIWQKTGKTIIFVTHSLMEAAYLSDKIVLMSSRPGKIIEVLNVTEKRPRDTESPELAAIRKELWSHISKEAKQQLM